MADVAEKRPTPDGWEEGDIVWEIAPDEVTPAIQAELAEHLANQRAEARKDLLREKVEEQLARRREMSGK